MKAKHNHGPNFGRRVPGCARCDELNAGSAPVAWRKRADEDARRVAEIRAHDCSKSRCGPVCTFGDW